MSELRVTGKTTDDKYTIGGIFNLYSTLGIPFEYSFEIIKERGYVVDWEDFFNEGISQGWSFYRLGLLADIISDVFGRQTSEKYKRYWMYRVEEKKIKK